MEQHQPVLAALTAADPEIADRLVSRRAAIARGASVSAAVAAGLRMASVPAAIAALSTDAFGQTRLPAVVIGVLNYALVLEDLENDFYLAGLAAPNLIPAADRTIFTTISAHETTHVQYLRQTLGAAARPKLTFDLTGGNGSGAGPYAAVLTNYQIFQALAQAFEDTGVRAYKGQAGALIPYPDVLQAALTIHSVEARHASEIRRLRGNFSDQGPFFQGWINGNQTDVPGAGPNYAGEENVVQGGVNVPPLAPSVSVNEVTESFDEPLTQAQVFALVDPFIV